jgi:hypothetical protein
VNWRLEQCRACRYQSSVTAGIVFHGTRVPLCVWFLGIFFLARHKMGTQSRTRVSGRARGCRSHELHSSAGGRTSDAYSSAVRRCLPKVVHGDDRSARWQRVDPPGSSARSER